MATPAELLHTWLHRQLPEAAAEWLNEKVQSLRAQGRDRDLNLAVSMVARKVGKDDLSLSPEDRDAAEKVRPGWDPRGWSVDQAARILLLLAADGTAEQFAERLDQLCRTADVGELVAFYRGLPLYPKPEQYVARAQEGVRTNMKVVFEAVAHRNPFPAEQFPEGAWNQMVLKALFIGSPLYPIQKLEERSNPSLMRMLCDYAHERWAAGRPVSPELWRCVGPHADAEALLDLEKVLGGGTEPECRAAALALSACPIAQAETLLQQAPELKEAIESGELSWETLTIEDE